MRNSQYPNPKIAERIQKVFWDNDLTDKQVADAIGMERKACMSYRNCVSNSHVAFIVHLCTKYKVSADWLLGIKE